MTPSIQFRGVTHRFGDVTALDGMDVLLEGGRIHGLLGRNGSGKSTMLSIASAFLKPTQGEVLIDGEPVFENPAAMAQVCLIRGSGDVLDQDWPDDRIGNALDFAAAIRPFWDESFADELVARFQVDRRKRLEELSRGQRAAVGVVLGLAARAPITMFDESHLGMDAPSRYAFYDTLVTDVAERPRTVVLSTHHIDEVSMLFEQVTIIDAGRLLLHEPAEALRGRGAVVTGPAEAVGTFVAGRTVLAERSLGRTRAVTVFGDLDETAQRDAAAAGVDLEPIALQDLFVHLTAGTGAQS